MPRLAIARLGVRGWLAAAVLALDLLVLRSQFEAVVQSAVCQERANFELILCVGPPDGWQILLTGALALGLAILLGMELATARRRDA